MKYINALVLSLLFVSTINFAAQKMVMRFKINSTESAQAAMDKMKAIERGFNGSVEPTVADVKAYAVAQAEMYRALKDHFEMSLNAITTFYDKSEALPWAAVRKFAFACAMPATSASGDELYFKDSEEAKTMLNGLMVVCAEREKKANMVEVICNCHNIDGSFDRLISAGAPELEKGPQLLLQMLNDNLGQGKKS